MSKAATRAAIGAAILGVGTIAYAFGTMDGSTPTPAGGQPPSVSVLSKAKDAGLGFVHVGNQAIQGGIAETGSLTAQAGNAAAGAGNSAANSNAVPAPPK